MPLIKRFAHCQIRINLKDHAPPHFHVLMRDGREVLIVKGGKHRTQVRWFRWDPIWRQGLSYLLSEMFFPCVYTQYIYFLIRSGSCTYLSAKAVAYSPGK